MDADEAVETIQREMTAFARRARASAGRMHPELSLVSYTLLGHLEESGGCRATDLAAHYALDKSTVSRQIDAAARLGLVERAPDPDDARAVTVQLTDAARERLNALRTVRLERWRAALAEWAPGDITELTRLLGQLTKVDLA